MLHSRTKQILNRTDISFVLNNILLTAKEFIQCLLIIFTQHHVSHIHPLYPYFCTQRTELSAFPFFFSYSFPIRCTLLDQHPIRVRLPLERGLQLESHHERKLTFPFSCLRSPASSEVLCHLPALVLEFFFSESLACFRVAEF